MEDQKRNFNAQVAGADSGFDGMQTSPAKPQKRSMPLIRYLIYLLIVTMTVTGVSLSRYATSTTTNASPARIAKFDVVVTHTATWSNGEYDDTSYRLGAGTYGYTFKVTNHSEIAVRARLVIDAYDSAYDSLPVINPAPLASPYPQNMSDWVVIAANGNFQNVSITLRGCGSASPPSNWVGANDLRMHFEYEQID